MCGIGTKTSERDFEHWLFGVRSHRLHAKICVFLSTQMRFPLKLLGAPGLSTRSKKILVTKSIATRSKKLPGDPRKNRKVTADQLMNELMCVFTKLQVKGPKVYEGPRLQPLRILKGLKPNSPVDYGHMLANGSLNLVCLWTLLGAPGIATGSFLTTRNKQEATSNKGS